jgi:hypothetical protein
MRGRWVLAAAICGCSGGLAAPAAGAPLIAAAGDIACATNAVHFNDGLGEGLRCRQADTANLISRSHYSAILALGDLMQNPRPDLHDYRSAYGASWGRFKRRTYPVIGNHDYGFRAAAGYFNYFNGIGRARGRAGERGRGWYSFDLGTWHLVALNANCGNHHISCGPGSPQMLWLEADLAAHPTKCTLAFWHQPGFSSGAFGNEFRVLHFWEALYQAGAEVVLNGHEHIYERFAPQAPWGDVDAPTGIVQFTVGTGGHSLDPIHRVEPNSRIRQNHTFGILRLRLGHGRFRWKYLASPSGTIVDRGVRRCHDPPAK